MAKFRKYAYEELYRYYEFARDDGNDGLAEDETIESCAVACVEKLTGTDQTATMISSVSIIAPAKVAYLLKGGVVGTAYIITVQVVTSNGQKIEGVVEITVI